MNPFARVGLAYLLNSAWQVALLYVVGLLLEWAARKATQELRHRLWVGILLLQVVLPAACLLPSTLLARLGPFLLSCFGLKQQGGDATVTVVFRAGHTVVGASVSHVLLPVLLAAYAGWSLFCCGRLAYRLRRIRNLRKQATPAKLPTAALERWHELCARFQVVTVDLRVSSCVAAPVTIGVRHKVLLTPAWFAQLPAAEMEIAYAHELAHMQRNDYAKNLCYEILALPVAYHPFLHLTRTRLAESREMVCDALAAEALNGTAPYARALLRLAARCISAATPVTVPQAIGIFDANTLERRLMSLKAGRSKVSFKHRIAMVTVCGAVMAGTCGSALALRIGVPEPQTQPQTQPQTAAQGTAAATEQPVQVPSGVMAGHTVMKVPPVYPEAAKQARIMGSVVLAARIGVDGHVENLTVVSGPPELQPSAIDAVRQWVFEPYMLSGSPVPVDTTVTINYQLAH